MRMLNKILLKMTPILEKDKAWKMAFKSNKQRSRAIEILKQIGFDVSNDFTKDCGYLFLSTYDNLKLGGWDCKEIYNERSKDIKPFSFNKLLELYN